MVFGLGILGRRRAVLEYQRPQLFTVQEAAILADTCTHKVGLFAYSPQLLGSMPSGALRGRQASEDRFGSSERKCIVRKPKRGVIATVVIAMIMTLALPALAITDGTVDAEDEYPFVAIAIQFVPGGAFVCSAEAVDEYHLVTAAHCFQDPLPPEAGGPPNLPVPGIQVRYGIDAFAPDTVVTGTWYPDDWCPFCGPGLPGFDSKDVAVIKLDAPVPLGEYIAPAEEGFSETLRNKTRIMQVGYGVNDFIPGHGPLAANSVFDGLRRFAPADLIASNHKHADEYLKLSSNPSQGKGGTCFGDSGGPIMYDNDGTWVLLGNNSYGTNGVCAGVGYANRMDTADALGFVDSVVNS